MSRSKKRPFKLTSAGWVFILYTIGIGAGAINTGNNLLYLMFGIFLGLILASGVLSDLSLWGLEASWDFPEHGEQGATSYIRVSVTNTKKKIASLGAALEMTGQLHGETVSLRAYVPWIPAGQTAVSHVKFTPVNRGRLVITTVKFTTQFPFGLLTKWWTFLREPQAQSLLIHPSSSPMDPTDPALSQADGVQTEAVPKKGEGVTLFGVREFRPSDSPRRVHWKASAKRADAENSSAYWLVKEMERDQKQDVFFVWNVEMLGGIRAEEAERLVRFGAGLTSLYEDQGRVVRMAVERPSRREVQEVKDVWEFLSLWDPAQPPEASVTAVLNAPVPNTDRSAAGVDAVSLFRFMEASETRAA